MMKKITLVALLMGASFSFGQITKPSFNRWSVDVNAGVNRTVKNFAPGHSSTLSLGGINAGARYMLNPNFGFKIDLGLESFQGDKNSTEFSTMYGRSTIHAVADLGNIFSFYNFTERFSLLAHAGVGLSSMSAEGLGFFEKDVVDFMGNAVAGLTPQFKLSNRVALNLDASVVVNSGQNRTLDFTQSVNEGGINNYYFTGTVGLSIYLGGYDTHADWTPHKSVSKDEFDALRADHEKMRKGMKDEDGDGVPNYLDKEPNTVVGTPVDLAGMADLTRVDTDKDGIPDTYDACPEEEGKYATNGCPDADGDLIADKDDKCPNEAGVASLNGCPMMTNKPVKVVPNLEPIYFGVAKSAVTSAEMNKLNRAVELLNSKPDYNVVIKGHTDVRGSYDLNQALSESRAESVRSYLVRKGIDPIRITTVAYGSSFPSSKDDSVKARAMNRRVELVVRN
jgi:OOP family OmpA-OmpF porin